MENEPSPCVKEVIATMEIEGYTLNDDTTLALQQLDKGEKSIDELIEMTLTHYRQGIVDKNI